MAEYIKRELAIESLIGWETEPTDEEIEYTLKGIPAADAVEVVRCKDCRHWICTGHDILLNKDFGSCSCSMWEYPHEYPETHETDFCSFAEREGKG